MIRWCVVLVCSVAASVYFAAPARADIGGSVPSPGGCDYPSVGTFGAAFGEYDYACQFPLEENGSRHTTLYGGGMWQVTASFGVSFMIFNASVSATVPAGANQRHPTPSSCLREEGRMLGTCYLIYVQYPK